MAEGDRQLAFTTGPVPTSVQVSGADRITPKTVNASFDGTGAAGAFLPCLIITGRTGHEVARIPASPVAAGASAEVSWFPRVGGGSGGAGGNGWQFDTDNEGGWGFVAANTVGPNGYGLQFDTGSSAAPTGFTNDGGFVVDTLGAVDIHGGSGIVLDPGGSALDVSGSKITNGAAGVAPTDFATVGQIGTGGVTSLDTITGAVTLVAGAGIAIADNTPTPGKIKISTSGVIGGPFTRGATSAVFTASATSATVTVTHGLGVTPTAVTMQGDDNGPAFPVCVVKNLGPTTFQFFIRDPTGIARTGTQVAYWVAFA